MTDKLRSQASRRPLDTPNTIRLFYFHRCYTLHRRARRSARASTISSLALHAKQQVRQNSRQVFRRPVCARPASSGSPRPTRAQHMSEKNRRGRSTGFPDAGRATRKGPATQQHQREHEPDQLKMRLLLYLVALLAAARHAAHLVARAVVMLIALEEATSRVRMCCDKKRAGSVLPWQGERGRSSVAVLTWSVIARARGHRQIDAVMVPDVEGVHRLESLLLQLCQNVVMPGGARGAKSRADGQRCAPPHRLTAAPRRQTTRPALKSLHSSHGSSFERRSPTICSSPSRFCSRASRRSRSGCVSRPRIGRGKSA